MGEGGMGSVYRVRYMNLKVNFISSELAGAGARRQVVPGRFASRLYLCIESISIWILHTDCRARRDLKHR